MYKDQMKIAQKDVRACLNLWKDILVEEFAGKIEYIYSKGSASKPWDSDIDYVPILSDVDIHVRFANSDNTTPLCQLSIDEALNLSQKYEESFTKRGEKSLHLPRTQVVSVNKLINILNFAYPRVEDIILLYGWYDTPKLPPDEKIREMDKERVLSDYSYLEGVPESTFDRTGLDFWSLLRRFNYRISPAPFRLLTQLLSITPYEIWAWNRSRVVKELNKLALTSLAESYQNYYITGWKLFLSNFTNSHHYRELFKYGYTVLSEIKRILKNT